MPHSISNNVTHSFISIASFPKGGQMWGKETVYLTILIELLIMIAKYSGLCLTHFH